MPGANANSPLWCDQHGPYELPGCKPCQASYAAHEASLKEKVDALAAKVKAKEDPMPRAEEPLTEEEEGRIREALASGREISGWGAKMIAALDQARRERDEARAERDASRLPGYYSRVEKELASARVELASIFEVLKRTMQTTKDEATKNELAHYSGWNTTGLGHGLELLEGYRAASVRALSAEKALEEVRAALGEAQNIVCSMLCPSVKRTGEEWTHADLCQRIRAKIGGGA